MTVVSIMFMTKHTQKGILSTQCGIQLASWCACFTSCIQVFALSPLHS